MLLGHAGSSRSIKGRLVPLPSPDEVNASICETFGEAQHGSASHRKNVHSLKKLLGTCSGSPALEQQFFVSVVRCLMVVLGLKRTDEIGSRMMRFLAGFIVYVTGENSGNEAAVRFVENLMLFSLEQLDSKDKTVRTRLAQIMVACLNSLEELSDEVWSIFRVKMTERLFDKEASVRAQALHAMSRLQGMALAEEGGLEVIDIFLDLLQHDPSADVRKTALLEVDITAKSLPIILERRRDTDVGIRRAFYAQKMQEVELGTLSVQQRDDILKAGLSDREDSVRGACAEMIFSNWIQKTSSNLIEFLAVLDVVAEPEAGEKALCSFFTLMPDMFATGFTAEPFWSSMTVEMSFVMRVYCQFVREARGVEATQELLPELTFMVGHLRRFYEHLVAAQDEVAKTDIECILQQLLSVVEMADQGDEVGRRLLNEALDDVLTNLEIGDGVYGAAIKVFHATLTREEFAPKIVDLVASFRDVYEVAPAASAAIDKSMEALSLNEELRILANLKALDIIRHALTVSAFFQVDPAVAGLLDLVVIPAVNSEFAAVQLAGLRSLTLFGTLSRELAAEYAPLMAAFYGQGQDEVKTVALQCLFDWFTMHGTEGSGDPFAACLRSLYDPDAAIQCVAAEGFSRLLLHRVSSDGQVLEGLLHLYFHPSTRQAPRLRQCLSYFVPAFAFSLADNQRMVQSAVGSFIAAYAKVADDALPVASVAAQLFYFCDPANLIRNDDGERDKGPSPFARIGEELAWAAFKDDVLAHAVIPRIPVDAQCPPQELRRFFLLVSHLVKCGAGGAALKKMVARLVELGASETQDGDEERELLARMRRLYPVSAAAVVKKRGPRSRAAVAAAGNILDEIEDFASEDGE